MGIKVMLYYNSPGDIQLVFKVVLFLENLLNFWFVHSCRIH